MPKTIHPTSRTLLAYLDGELPVDDRSAIKDHLKGCSSCQEELDTMEADLDWFLVLEAASRTPDPPADPGGLNRLLASARDWQSSHAGVAAPQEAEDGVEKHAVHALEVFFGPGVAAAAETASAETLLATFLGKRAADALMSDIRRGNPPRLMPSDVS